MRSRCTSECVSFAPTHLLPISPQVLSTWCGELERWCPSLRVIKLHSSDTHERERLKARVSEEVGSYDVVVTTYEMAKSPVLRSVLVQKIYWRLLVLDEVMLPSPSRPHPAPVPVLFPPSSHSSPRPVAGHHENEPHCARRVTCSRTPSRKSLRLCAGCTSYRRCSSRALRCRIT